MSDEELPAGWATAALDDLLESRRSGFWGESGPDDQAAKEVRVVRNGDIEPDGSLAGSVARWFSESEQSRSSVRAGDVLMTTSGQIGKVHRVRAGSPDLCASNFVRILRPLAAIDSNYVYWLMRSPVVGSQIADHSGGSTMSNLRTSFFSGTRVPLAPHGEQTRVVAEIERRLSHVDAAERSLRVAAAKLRGARVAVLQAASRGELTNLESSEDMAVICSAAGINFAECGQRRGWVATTIDQIAKVGSGSTPKRDEKKYWENGTVPWVTSGQVVGGKITKPAEYITQTALTETSVKMWPAGTLLVAMYGEGRTRGHTAELCISATCNQACAAICLRDEFKDWKELLKLVLQARYEENRVLGSGGVQENLNLGLVKTISVELPPPDLRDALVAEAQRRLSLIESAEKSLISQLSRCAGLRRSILAAAFRGELVAQDPTDEPAEVLLQRIRDERAAAGQSKAVKKKATNGTRKPRVKKEAAS